MAEPNLFSVEKNLVVNNKEIIYKGPFKADELFSTINKALESKGYIKNEKKSEDLVTPEGRALILELRPYKEVTNYITLMLKIRVTLDNVTEEEGIQNGDVNVIFDAWSITDYEHRWGMKPWVYFLKGIINKFIYQFPLETGFVSEVMSDTAYVYAQVKKLLKSYDGGEDKFTPEEEVRKEMEEEIKKVGNA
jgi:hypothetical protein